MKLMFLAQLELKTIAVTRLYLVSEVTFLFVGWLLFSVSQCREIQKKVLWDLKILFSNFQTSFRYVSLELLKNVCRKLPLEHLRTFS